MNSIIATGYRQCLSVARVLERQPLALAFLFAWDDAGRGSLTLPNASLTQMIQRHFRSPTTTLTERDKVHGLFELLRWMRTVQDMAAQASSGPSVQPRGPVAYTLQPSSNTDRLFVGTLVVSHPSELQSRFHRAALLGVQAVGNSQMRCVDLGNHSGETVSTLATYDCKWLPSWNHFATFPLWLGGPQRMPHPIVIHSAHSVAERLGHRRASFYVHTLHALAALPPATVRNLTPYNSRVLTDCHLLARQGKDLTHASFVVRLHNDHQLAPLLATRDPWGLVMRGSQYPLFGGMRWLPPRLRADFRDRRYQFSTSSHAALGLARWASRAQA